MWAATASEAHTTFLTKLPLADARIVVLAKRARGRIVCRMRIAVLDRELLFPEARQATKEGLVAIGGDLSVERLLLAYRSGIFPWTIDPITWWSPEPRAILELDGFHISRSLSRVIRRRLFRVTIDRVFRAVMQGSGARGPG